MRSGDGVAAEGLVLFELRAPLALSKGRSHGTRASTLLSPNGVEGGGVLHTARAMPPFALSPSKGRSQGTGASTLLSPNGVEGGGVLHMARAMPRSP